MQKYAWLVILSTVVFLFALWSIYNFNIQEEEVDKKLNKRGKVNYDYEGHNITFNLRDPEAAPEDIKEQVMKGYSIVLETRKNAPKYAHDRLDCRNCHFGAGDTTGGKNNGISLVGVAEKYPRKMPDGTMLSLAERVDYCFEKSMNGARAPHDSPEMKAILAYFDWISGDIPKLESYPWLGLKKLKSLDTHTPNLKNGKWIYLHKCATCHGNNGEGQELSEGLSNPPLWGPDSFNSAAGFNRLAALSAFIFDNMPQHDPSLTEKQAIDVAAYVIAQPRLAKKDVVGLPQRHRNSKVTQRIYETDRYIKNALK